MTVRWRGPVALFAVLSILTGCTSTGPSAPPPQSNRPTRELEPAFGGAPTLPPPDMVNDGPGSLVEVKPLDDALHFDQVNATAVRIVYRSTSENGKASEVSGMVAVPPGDPPRDGWPIISFGHGMTGVENICAPTLVKDLGGYAAPISVLLSRGYVVAMSDYQGLGIKGYNHSIVDAVTLGNNMIDVVRAARRVVPSTNANWAAFGTGEGGLASWAAAERAPEYGNGLNLVGSVALSPFADLSGLADAAQSGTLTRDQYKLQILLLQGLANYRSDFDLDAYRSGVAKDQWGLLTDCAPKDPDGAQRVAGQVRAGDLRPQNDAAVTNLRDVLTDNALPIKSPTPAVAPILIVYASQDPLVQAKGVEAAYRRSCTKGDPIAIVKRIGDTNTSNDTAVQMSLSWLRSRFDGERPANVCVGPG